MLNALGRSGPEKLSSLVTCSALARSRGVAHKCSYSNFDMQHLPLTSPLRCPLLAAPCTCSITASGNTIAALTLMQQHLIPSLKQQKICCHSLALHITLERHCGEASFVPGCEGSAADIGGLA